MSKAYGYRFPTELEQLALYERFEWAIEHRKPVVVTFFEQKRDAHGRPMWFDDKRPYLVKTTRTVEPYELQQTIAGNLIVRVIDRSPRDAERPDYRTIRLDRIAVSLHTGKPKMTVKHSGRYLVPNPHLEERELTSA